MYNYLLGEIVDYVGSNVVLDVNGIGYELAVSAYTMADCKLGNKQKLYAYLQVKEDGVTLFGFSTLEEKNLFLLLISVSGVGGKGALAALSGMDHNSLALAIYNGDTSKLTKIKGVGKKTAERLVLELKEKVAVDAAAVTLRPIETAQLSKDMQDAIAVLVSLGKAQSDAEQLVEAASKLGATTANELVNMAFRIN